jgi:hypothetical protein|tara:strand:+ start:232 stop:510 length:279 start_codon:yes stop_codon:yes gene_type:complete
MPKELAIKLSEESMKNLVRLAKKSGLTKSAAASWVLKETAVPVILKRSKETRNESIALTLDVRASTVLETVMRANKSSESVVLEAYLLRGYA